MLQYYYFAREAVSLGRLPIILQQLNSNLNKQVEKTGKIEV